MTTEHTPSEVELMRREMTELQARLERLEQEKREKRKRRGLLLVVAVVLVSATAVAQVIPFNAGQPAYASDVNANFTFLQNWIQDKVGPPGQGVTLKTPLAVPLPGDQIAPNSITSTQLSPAIRSLVDCNPPTGVGNTRLQYGQCIWESGGGGLTYTNAAAFCTGYGYRLCTLAELGAAQAAGMSACANGWVADRVNDTTGYIGYPNQTTSVGCGAAGLRFSGTAFTTPTYAWCCKP
jgi:hypothetical protein